MTATAVAVGRCPHCGTATEGGDAYCCPGCAAAAAIVAEAGLDRYYSEREALPDRPDGAVADWRGVPDTLLPDGTREVRAVIDGLKCASCVWVTERVLQATPGVLDAMVSYGSGRVRLRFDPATTDPGRAFARVATLGYRPRPLSDAAPSTDDVLVRLGVSAFLTANLMLLSASLYAAWWGEMAPRFVAVFQWGSLALATPVALWCARPFAARAISGLRHGVLHVDLPVSLGVAVMYTHGVWATLTGQDAWLDSLGMLVTLLLGGRALEARGRSAASAAATALAARLPATARRVLGAIEEAVPVEHLGVGDVILLGPGDEVPVDGVVTTGRLVVDQALLTGESAPSARQVGDEVRAGTRVVDGAARVRADRVGAATVLHRMAEELRDAVDRREERSLADRLAPAFTAVTLLVAAGTLLGWTASSGLDVGVRATVAVLVVACPCALALAQPLAAAAGLGAAARRGLLVRSPAALLRMADVETVAFDKTGTLTRGRPDVVDADPGVLRIAAGLERYSRHPIARAVVAEAIARGIPLPEAADLHEEPGVGIDGQVDGVRYRIRAADGGVAVLGPDGALGVIRLTDVIRPDAADQIGAVLALGLHVAVLSGDAAMATRAVASSARIDEAFAEVGPAGKAAWIRARPGPVLFVGDGLNDGPALAAAHVGVAMATGATSSLLAADAALVGESLAPVPMGIRAARATRAAVRASVVRSVAYNVIAVAAAASGLVNPLVAAVLMPLSSLAVLWGAAGVERAVARGDA